MQPNCIQQGRFQEAYRGGVSDEERCSQYGRSWLFERSVIVRWTCRGNTNARGLHKLPHDYGQHDHDEDVTHPLTTALMSLLKNCYLVHPWWKKWTFIAKLITTESDFIVLGHWKGEEWSGQHINDNCPAILCFKQISYLSWTEFS